MCVQSSTAALDHDMDPVSLEITKLQWMGNILKTHLSLHWKLRLLLCVEVTQILQTIMGCFLLTIITSSRKFVIVYDFRKVRFSLPKSPKASKSLKEGSCSDASQLQHVWKAYFSSEPCHWLYPYCYPSLMHAG